MLDCAKSHVRILDLTGRWAALSAGDATIVADLAGLLVESAGARRWIIGQPNTLQLENELLTAVHACRLAKVRVAVGLVGVDRSPGVDRCLVRLAAANAGSNVEFGGHDLAHSPDRVVLLRTEREEADLRHDLTMLRGEVAALNVWMTTHHDLMRWDERFGIHPEFLRFDKSWFNQAWPDHLDSWSEGGFRWPLGAHVASGRLSVGPDDRELVAFEMRPLSVVIVNREGLGGDVFDPYVMRQLVGDVVPRRVVAGWLLTHLHREAGDGQASPLVSGVLSAATQANLSPVGLLLSRCAEAAVNDLLMRKSPPDASLATLASLGGQLQSVVRELTQQTDNSYVRDAICRVSSMVERSYMDRPFVDPFDIWAREVIDCVVRIWRQECVGLDHHDLL